VWVEQKDLERSFGKIRLTLAPLLMLVDWGDIILEGVKTWKGKSLFRLLNL
jgi:hypothetical protein